MKGNIPTNATEVKRIMTIKNNYTPTNWIN